MLLRVRGPSLVAEVLEVDARNVRPDNRFHGSHVAGTVGETGYDECFGHGRIDALRAVTGGTDSVRDETAPDCSEYQERRGAGRRGRHPTPAGNPVTVQEPERQVQSAT
jgi:hypothetical protein